MHEPTFHPALPTDIPTLLDLMAEFYAIDSYPFDARLNQINLEQFLDNPDLGRLWLIHLENTPIGYICLAYGFSFEYKGRDAFIDEFFIKPAFRNQGIGQKTLDFVEQQASSLGVNAIHLEVEHHNAAGNWIYEKRGYAGKKRYMLTKYLA